MTANSMRKASLAELRAMKDRGELAEPETDVHEQSLGEAYWAQAEIEMRSPPRSVHLKLDPDVFEYFRGGGKSHLTRMQNVLKAYVRAKRGATG